MADQETGGVSPEQTPLDKAAERGRLPGVEEEDEMEKRGEDHSETTDADQNADDVGRGDLPGAISMGHS